MTGNRIFAAILVLILITLSLVSFSIPSVSFPNVVFGDVTKSFEDGSIMFVGDIMLGRYVETLLEEEGALYPFLEVQDLIENNDITIGNFEGTIPDTHKQTPLDSMQFSINAEHMNSLKSAGFDILSLANNHSFDFDTEGYENTRTVCQESGLLCAGHPLGLGTSSAIAAIAGDTRLGILTLYAESLDMDDTEELLHILSAMRKRTEVQVAYIHWGVEYAHTHTSEQETLAHFLIDHGIDVVIGHHPHVVQDIEFYNNKPIFYSLGNFVFDQYFSVDVQEGLMVKMALNHKTIEYILLPVEMHSMKSQPQLMEGEHSVQLFDRILGSTEVKQGHSIATFSVPRTP